MRAQEKKMGSHAQVGSVTACSYLRIPGKIHKNEKMIRKEKGLETLLLKHQNFIKRKTKNLKKKREGRR